MSRSTSILMILVPSNPWNLRLIYDLINGHLPTNDEYLKKKLLFFLGGHTCSFWGPVMPVLDFWRRLSGICSNYRDIHYVGSLRITYSATPAKLLLASIMDGDLKQQPNAKISLDFQQVWQWTAIKTESFGFSSVFLQTFEVLTVNLGVLA